MCGIGIVLMYVVYGLSCVLVYSIYSSPVVCTMSAQRYTAVSYIPMDDFWLSSNGALLRVEDFFS